MTTTPPYFQSTCGPLFFTGSIALLPLLPMCACAEFKGGDHLESNSSNWEQPFADVGGANLVFRNSRLEYRVKSPTHEDKSALRWTTNEGGYGEDWFIQVDAHFENLTMNKGSDTVLNMGVVHHQNPKRQYMIGFNHSRMKGFFDDYIYTSRIVTSYARSGWPLGESIEATNVKLRLHFDHHAKTLTGSWKSGAYWKYFEPEPVSNWDMDDADTFTAMLTASGGGFDEETSGPVVPPGTAWFRNFKTGKARPEMAIDQPAGSGMQAGSAKRSFGTVALGRRATRTFAVHNMGTAKLKQLKITSGGADAADFQITGPAGTSLKPGASTSFEITFHPQGTGTRKATIRVSCNDPETTPFDIKLAGEGVK